MVIRREGEDAVAIGQPAHAWLCGQFARAWGNARFGAVAPLDEVALGAEQHDTGMAEWDAAPAVDPQTGWPLSFMEMGVAVNARLWRAGPARLVPQSRYAALLAVMHGVRLYSRRPLSALAPDAATEVGALLDESAVSIEKLRAALRGDPQTAPFADDATVERNSRLLWAWDQLSLGLLLHWAPFTLDGVPAAGAGETIDVTVTSAGGRAVTLSPWPFADPERVTVRCEGRRLAPGTRLVDGTWETLTFVLEPAA